MLVQVILNSSSGIKESLHASVKNRRSPGGRRGNKKLYRYFHLS